MISDEITFKHSNIEVKIDINIYPGNSRFFLVLTGLGGDVSGFDSKYEKIANSVNTDYGCTVLVASTPELSWMHSEDNFKHIMEYISGFALENGFYDYDISIFANSAGATFAVWYSYQYIQVKRLLLVNSVLNADVNKLKEGLKNFDGESVIFIFGEFDESMYYLPLLDDVNPLAEVFILDDVDHNFKDNVELFIELPEKYLFSKF